MSLKARFRIAIVALTVAIVIGMSALYVHGFIQDSFDRTADVAQAIASGVQSATFETLKNRTNNLAPPPPNLEAAKKFWLETVDSDPAIKGVLERALASWHQIAEVFLTDSAGRIRGPSGSKRAGQPVGVAVNFEEWKQRSLFGNIRQVFFQSEDTEFVRTLGVDHQKVLTIHVVISSLFLRNSLKPKLVKLGEISLAALLISVALALLLPSLIVDPLERLTERIDQMAAGSAVTVKSPVNEVKEFALAHSKLNVLGQQVEGAREDVSELRSKVAQLLEQLKEAVLLFDTSGRLVMAGPTSRRLLGWEPGAMVDRRAEEIFPPETTMGMLLKQALEKREPVRDRLVTINAAGAEHQVLASIEPLVKIAAGGGTGMPQPIGVLVALHDAQTRGQIEEQLDIADRLSAISQLTRGVAHEIKNPLNAITVHLEVLKNRIGPDDAPELDVIGREIARLNRVVKTFLDFHRPVDVRRRRLDLNELICDLAKLVEPDAAAQDIEVRCLSFGCPVWIDADRDLLKQAFLNVVMNGLEAMPDGGSLTLSCGRVDGACRVEISDTGPGIPPEIRDKIFNLYFTTKGKGSGIGLSMAYRFVQLLDGKMSFTSEASRGATFIFELPEASSQQSAEPARCTQSV